MLALPRVGRRNVTLIGLPGEGLACGAAAVDGASSAVRAIATGRVRLTAQFYSAEGAKATIVARR